MSHLYFAPWKPEEQYYDVELETAYASEGRCSEILSALGFGEGEVTVAEKRTYWLRVGDEVTYYDSEHQMHRDIGAVGFREFGHNVDARIWRFRLADKARADAFQSLVLG